MNYFAVIYLKVLTTDEGYEINEENWDTQADANQRAAVLMQEEGVKNVTVLPKQVT